MGHTLDDLYCSFCRYHSKTRVRIITVPKADLVLARWRVIFPNNDLFYSGLWRSRTRTLSDNIGDEFFVRLIVPHHNLNFVIGFKFVVSN